MPPVRRRGSPNTSKSPHADETDEEFDPETPRPQKTHLRSRPSESSKTGRQKQLSSLAAPEIDVPLDILSSNFEEWMKMATDNVRSQSHPPIFISLIVLIENQSGKLVEFCAYRLFSRYVSVEE